MMPIDIIIKKRIYNNIINLCKYVCIHKVTTIYILTMTHNDPSYMYVCMHVCMCTHVCMCKHVCMCMHASISDDDTQ
jgi:hypothetical protein